MVLKLQMIYSLAKCLSSFYSVSYGATAVKICHETNHEQAISARERTLCQLTVF